MYFVKVYSAKLKGQHDINRYAYVITLSFFMLNAIVLTGLTLNVAILSVIMLSLFKLKVTG
jgi:hypothetical protein